MPRRQVFRVVAGLLIAGIGVYLLSSGDGAVKFLSGAQTIIGIVIVVTAGSGKTSRSAEAPRS